MPDQCAGLAERRRGDRQKGMHAEKRRDDTPLPEADHKLLYRAMDKIRGIRVRVGAKQGTRVPSRARSVKTPNAFVEALGKRSKNQGDDEASSIFFSDERNSIASLVSGGNFGVSGKMVHIVPDLGEG